MPQITSIICPFDFSDFSVNAYRCARSIAWHYKAEVFLQHILYPLGFVGYDSTSCRGTEGAPARPDHDYEEKWRQNARPTTSQALFGVTCAWRHMSRKKCRFGATCFGA